MEGRYRYRIERSTMKKAKEGLFYTLMLLALHVCAARSGGSRGLGRAIKILNESGMRIAVYWIHPNTRDASPMTDSDGVVNGAEFPLDSYVGHEFELRELNCESSANKSCRQAFFKVSENDEQLAKLSADFTIEFVDNKIKSQMQAGDLIKECEAAAKAKIAASPESTSAAMDELLKCVEAGVTSALEAVNEEIAFQASVRKDIAAMLENYTCVDDTLNSTADISTSTWVDPKDTSTSHLVHIKHDRAASRIHVIENFIRDDECAAMARAAEKDLHRATVADGKGGSRLSENRKAMQAGIKVPWNKPFHPISRVSRRVYDYVNHVLGLNIQHNGQEDLMSIQYFGRGKNDTEPDRYTPHCDGDCTGMPHKWGTRMATVVMYCDVADLGGHTNFRNAGVHVKPESHDAVFFSYIDPVTLTMDSGFTEHSGCPVYEGTKRIVTQWIRLGVDDENPWDSFNTLGIKKSEMDS